MSINLEDVALWNAFREGDLAALGMIMKRHYRLLYHYASRFSHDDEFIKDCIQEMFLELLKNRLIVGEVQFIRAYLLKVLRRKMHNNGKQSTTLVFITDWDHEPGFETELSAESWLIEEERVKEHAQKIASILNQLPKRQKEVLYLRYFKELDHAEIAHAMSLTQQAVYNLLSKALKQFREHWHAGSRSLLSLLLALGFSASLY